MSNIIQKIVAPFIKGYREAKAEREERRQMRVYRTKEGTLYEIVVAVLLLVMWALVLIHYLRTAEHDPSLIMLCGLGTLTCVFVLYGAYHPELINSTVSIRNARQLELAVRMTRVVAVLMALIFMVIPISAMWHFPSPPTALIGVAVVAVVMFFEYKIRKAQTS